MPLPLPQRRMLTAVLQALSIRTNGASTFVTLAPALPWRRFCCGFARLCCYASYCVRYVFDNSVK
jgi:hypothetical protein